MRQLCACLCLVLVGLVIAPAHAQELDAAGKKFLAANGLFQRQLYKLAAGEYEEFLKESPAHPQAAIARHALAVCWFRTGEYQKAADAFQSLLRNKDFKQADEAMLALGHCRLALKQQDQALKTFEELLAKFPQSPSAEPAALNRAQLLYLLGRGGDAEPACDEFLKKYPKSDKRGEALYFLALSQRANHKEPAASATLIELVVKCPETRYQTDALLLLGQLLEQSSQLDLAAARYQAIADKAPADRQADGWFSLGMLRYRQARYDDAIAALGKVGPASQHAARGPPAARSGTGGRVETLGCLRNALPCSCIRPRSRWDRQVLAGAVRHRPAQVRFGSEDSHGSRRQAFGRRAGRQHRHGPRSASWNSIGSPTRLSPTKRSPRNSPRHLAPMRRCLARPWLCTRPGSIKRASTWPAKCEVNRSFHGRASCWPRISSCSHATMNPPRRSRRFCHPISRKPSKCDSPAGLASARISPATGRARSRCSRRWPTMPTCEPIRSFAARCCSWAMRCSRVASFASRPMCWRNSHRSRPMTNPRRSSNSRWRSSAWAMRHPPTAR